MGSFSDHSGIEVHLFKKYKSKCKSIFRFGAIHLIKKFPQFENYDFCAIGIEFANLTNSTRTKSPSLFAGDRKLVCSRLAMAGGGHRCLRIRNAVKWDAMSRFEIRGMYYSWYRTAMKDQECIIGCTACNAAGAKTKFGTYQISMPTSSVLWLHSQGKGHKRALAQLKAKIDEWPSMPLQKRPRTISDRAATLNMPADHQSLLVVVCIYH